MLVPSSKKVDSFVGSIGDVKLKNGYVKFHLRDEGEEYKGIVVFRDGKPVLASLEEVNLRKQYRGNEALNIILNKILEINVYKLSRREVEVVEYFNRAYAVGAEESLDVEIPIKIEIGCEKVESLEEYVNNLGNFTGVVYATGDNFTAEVYLDSGKIVGAKVTTDGRTFEGNSALYYLNRSCFVRRKRKNEVEVPDSCKVEEVRVDVSSVKLDDRLRKLIQEIQQARQ